ncbi:hypothetical protein OMW55_04325 [Sphingomonas sp. BN140010]|uniref:Uncharacterized protein n=1 Tax=Sphingomonas arvum TaxID=2992113 RepID=A0ABT3JD86_9SPHN|nr:hypothetical protein [Sphingomonas sp. BN140010]MCW3797030.1 hypothetical protein [Sphingomonas sp. BN140010]
MPRAATDVMQSILFSAVLDAIAALKTASGNLPNNLLRQVQAIHNNVTFADLPEELQAAISASTRTAFTQLLKEGYSVAPRDAVAAPTRTQPRHGEVVDRGARGPRGPRPTGGARPGGSGGPPRGPRPAGGGPGGGKPRGPRKP